MAYRDIVLADTPYLYMELAGVTNGGTGSNTTYTATRGGITWAAGIENVATTAAVFNGTTSYIQYNNNQNDPFLSSDRDWTVETWIKPNAPTTWANIVHREGTSKFALRIDAPGTTHASKITLEYRGASAGVTLVGPVATDSSKWYHIVVTHSSGTARMYVDGVLYDTKSTISTGVAFTTQAWRIGAYGTTSNNENFKGTVDEVAIYNRALAESEIIEHLVAGGGTPPTPQTPPEVHVTVQAPAGSANITAPAPVVTAVDAYKTTLIANRDRQDRQGATGSGGTSTTLTFGGTYYATIGFPTPTIQQGMRLASAKLRVYVAIRNSPTGGIAAKASRVSAQLGNWTETGSDVASPALPESVGPVPPTQAGWLEIDVTNILQAYLDGTYTNTGFMVSAPSEVGSAYTIYSREGANPPQLVVQVEDIPGIDIVSPVTGAMELTATMPQHRFGVGTESAVVGAGSLSVEMPAPTVSVAGNPVTQVPAITLTMQFPGGESRNPDTWIKPNSLEMWLFSPNARGNIGYPVTVPVSGAMELTIGGTEGTLVDLSTDRHSFVIGAMNMTAKMVGIYFREGDRYFNHLPNTFDSDDMWLPMDEVDGTVATDQAIGIDSNGVVYNRHNGEYFGGPTLQAEGPYLRRAVAFDGVDDRVELDDTPYGGVFSLSDFTYEFAIKTTQLNGTLIDGGARYQTPTTGVVGGTGRGEIRLENGYITLVNHPENDVFRYKVDKFIADGEWHHIVISLPMTAMNLWDAYNISRARQHFVMVDGEIEWARYHHGFGGLIPQTLMARTYDRTSYDNFLKGSMSSFVFRLNNALDAATARKLYYEWSNATLVNPEPMTVNLAMKAPARARGNVKRMIAIYGLPYGIDDGYRNGTAMMSRDGWGNYFSMFAGYYIKNAPYEVSTPTGVGNIDSSDISWSSNGEPLRYLPVKPFMLEGYMVYPLAIHKLDGSNGGPFSAAGMENGKHIDPYSKVYVDDETGLPRFVNLQKDLVEDVMDYDAITVINYPALRPEDGGNVSSDALRQPRQHNIGLTNGEWDRARDAFRDSIMEAVYNGVSLWITEPEMAVHCGFIQGYDIHETGARVEFGFSRFDPISATGYTNWRARELDKDNFNPAFWTDEDDSLEWIPSYGSGINYRPPISMGGSVGRWFPAVGNGQYNFTWQANAKRQIVNLEPGLTDLPGYERTDTIHWIDDDKYVVYSDWVAYNVIDRRGGLQVGDQLFMDMWEQDDYTGDYPAFNGWAVGIPRKLIVSAKPDGIAGKPISKEVDFYYGPYGQIRPNPWKNNVYTIVAETGTVVRGRPIAGRAFIEFMDVNTETVKIPEDRVKNKWLGRADQDYTRWSFDTRRYKEMVVLNIISGSMSRTLPNGDKVKRDYRYDQRHLEVEDQDLIWQPFYSMNARGLNWLAKAQPLEAGVVRQFAPAMTISLDAPDAIKVSRTKNLAVAVDEPMTVSLELRQPRSHRGNDVRERTTPMRLTLEMRGIGRANKVPPMTINLSAVNPRVTGDGEMIYVYMDANRNITLFMKEDS